jgi:cholesterol transport system auxiliary component
MKYSISISALALVAASLATGGCALFSKSELVRVRYFSLDESSARQAPHEQPPPIACSEQIALRLGRISAPEHLEERLVYRSSLNEVGYYKNLRWTDRPEEYLRRALARELFEVRGLARVVSGAAPTLDVELTAFEEVRGPIPKARLGLTFVLHDEKSVQIERSLTIDRNIPDSDADSFVKALSGALAGAVERVTGDVVRELERQRAVERLSEDAVLELDREGPEQREASCATPDAEPDD